MDRALRNEAEALVAEAEVDAKSVLSDGLALARRADSGPWVRSVALRAAAIAARSMDRFDEASGYFGESIQTARWAQLPDAEGEALTSRAGLLALTGQTEDALADLDRADTLLDGAAVAHVAVQRAGVVHQAGDFVQAEELYATALHLCRHYALSVEEARILSNRSLLLIERGAYDDAHASLVRASSILREARRAEDFLPVAHNLGYLALCRGSIVEAVSHLDAHRRAALAAGASPFAASADLAEALLAAGLADDSARESLTAGAHFESQGAQSAAAHAFVAAGRAALAAGRAPEAVEHVERGLGLSPTAGRSIWRAVHETTLIEARLAADHLSADGNESRQLVARIEEVVTTLRDAGLARHRRRAELVAATLALATGRISKALAILETLRADGQLRLEERCSLWHVVGLVELEMHRPGSAMRSFSRAMAAADEIRLSVRWMETAAALGLLQARIGTDGLRATLAGPAHPHQLLRWMEATYRTATVGRPPSISSSRLDDALTTARRATFDVASQINRDAPIAELGAATASQARAEDEVTRALRSSGKPLPRVIRATRDLRADVKRLSRDQLLEMAEVDGRLHAITTSGGRLRKHQLGSAVEARQRVTIVRALIRTSWRQGQARPELERELERLDELLVPPTVRREDRPLMIVTPPFLSSLPLGLLPSLRQRPFACESSLTDHVIRRSRRVLSADALQAVFVAGPELASVDEEVLEAATHYATSVILRDESASTERLLAELHADVLHVACHGTVRHDAPLFSALHLHDGPLAVSTLIRAGQFPRLVVLSACEAGRPIRRAGGAVTLPMTLLNLGAHIVVASSVAIPDSAAVQPMVSLHRLLVAGRSVAEALMTIRSSGDALNQLVGGMFVAYGLGTLPIVAWKG
ncbi:MAG: CHAT domain-containing protein [bacterium]|nr:CHAT domain-containing protein [bacterium]